VIVDAKNKTSERAYFIWEALGRPQGHALDHWLQAEAELLVAPEVQPKKKAVKKKTKAASSRKKAKKSS